MQIIDVSKMSFGDACKTLDEIKGLPIGSTKKQCKIFPNIIFLIFISYILFMLNILILFFTK